MNAADLPETASFAGFARILGVKPQAVTALRHADRLVLTADGKRVQVAASQQRIRDTADPSKAGVVARHAAERAAKAATGAEGAQSHPEGDWGAQRPSFAASARDQGADPVGGAYQASRAVRERYLAMEAKRAFEVNIGKLMDAREVEQATGDAITTLRTRLESLPDVLGPQLSAVTDEAQTRAMLAEAIEHALEEAARQFSNLSKRDPA